MRGRGGGDGRGVQQQVRDGGAVHRCTGVHQQVRGVGHGDA